MKLFFWRRKPQPASQSSSTALEPRASLSASSVAVVERSQIPTRPLAVPVELRDALLRFALDCLVSGGARVRVEADDLITATQPDGSVVRYTTSLARAHAEDGIELLVQGGSALANLLDECAAHGAVASVALAAHANALNLARTQVAVPATACGVCAHEGNAELCQMCPRRADRLVLAGLASDGDPRVARQWIGRSIELTYAVVANDRHGRRDEDVRLAFDGESGQALPLLTAEVLADARAQSAVEFGQAVLSAAQAHAEQALGPRLRALGTLLRLVEEREYRARLDDIQMTSQRLLRESPGEEAAIHGALERELERLRDVYAVDVEARLAGVCFVERPMAAIAFRTRTGSVVELLADLASGVLLAPICALCGARTHVASVCDAGHLICATCVSGGAALASAGCPVCAGRRRAPEPSSRDLDEFETLTPALLDAMSAATWRLFAAWLLEQEGFRVESAGVAAGAEFWTCHTTADDPPLIACAIRFADRRALSGLDLDRLAARQSSHPARAAILISTAVAGPAAHEAARRLGVRLLDRAALTERLPELAVHHLHERETATRAQEARADAAVAARTVMLSELEHAEEALASAGNAHRAKGRSAVAAATRGLTGSLALASRALLAWETLVNDWSSAFDDREARDGSLSIRMDVAELAEIAERAQHLGTALTESLDAVAATPEAGDLGYAAWRRDIVEQLAAQCEACRWHVMAIDPSEWRAFSAAHDALADERATSAATTAAHAASRSARSYGDLVRRARIAEASA